MQPPNSSSPVVSLLRIVLGMHWLACAHIIKVEISKVSMTHLGNHTYLILYVLTRTSDGCVRGRQCSPQILLPPSSACSGQCYVCIILPLQSAWLKISSNRSSFYFYIFGFCTRTRVRVGLKTAQIHVFCPPLSHYSCRHVSSCLCKCFQVDKLTNNLKGTQRFPTVHIRVRIWPGRLIFKKQPLDLSNDQISLHKIFAIRIVHDQGAFCLRYATCKNDNWTLQSR